MLRLHNQLFSTTIIDLSKEVQFFHVVNSQSQWDKWKKNVTGKARGGRESINGKFRIEEAK